MIEGNNLLNMRDNKSALGKVSNNPEDKGMDLKEEYSRLEFNVKNNTLNPCISIILTVFVIFISIITF